MSEIVIGDFRFVCNGHALLIGSKAAKGGVESFPSLDPGQVKDLNRFITNALETQLTTRHSFRVMLWDDVELHTSLVLGGSNLMVKALDLSLTGIQVECPLGSDPNLREGDELKVELGFEGSLITLGAAVRRKNRSRYGLFFQDSVRGEQIIPPPELTDIIMELQRQWLQLRSELAENQ